MRLLEDVPLVIKPNRLAHVVFRTKQLDAMIEWYCKVLGAHVVFRNGHIAFLTYDDEHHRIALLQSDALSARAPAPAVGFYHAAFTYEDLSTLLANYRRLKAVDIEPYRSIIHGPTVSQYYRDPDGNELELQVDVFDDADEATAWMHGDAFQNDPIGQLFQPDEMIAQLQAGVPVQILMRRTDA